MPENRSFALRPNAKKKNLTKSDILLDLALVRGLVSMQNKHYV